MSDCSRSGPAASHYRSGSEDGVDVDVDGCIYSIKRSFGLDTFPIPSPVRTLSPCQPRTRTLRLSRNTKYCEHQ